MYSSCTSEWCELIGSVTAADVTQSKDIRRLLNTMSVPCLVSLKYNMFNELKMNRNIYVSLR